MHVKEKSMSEREPVERAETPEEEPTDIGEGQRGVVSPSRGGTFGSTPGESGDTGESTNGTTNSPIPHLQDE